MGVLMRWWMLLYVCRTTVETCFLFPVNLLKMEKWECKLLLVSFLCLHVQKTIFRRIWFDNDLWTIFSGHQKIRKFGIQEVERPDNDSLIREQKGLVLKHGKFPLLSNLAKGNFFHYDLQSSKSTMQIVYIGLLTFSSNSFCSNKRSQYINTKQKALQLSKHGFVLHLLFVGQRHFLSSQINYAV